MKKHLTILAAGALLLCLITAFGCGTVNETTKATTPQPTTSAETTDHTSAEMSTTASETTETTGTSAETSDTILDPMLPLPDLDNPMTDVEPNIPESGVDNNGALGDIFDGNGTNDMNENDMGNANGNSGTSDMSDTNRNGDLARGRNRRDANSSNPALPTK